MNTKYFSKLKFKIRQTYASATNLRTRKVTPWQNKDKSCDKYLKKYMFIFLPQKQQLSENVVYWKRAVHLSSLQSDLPINKIGGEMFQWKLELRFVFHVLLAWWVFRINSNDFYVHFSLTLKCWSLYWLTSV